MWPRDIAEERARLQAGVPRFDSDAAFAEIERSLGRPLSEMFASLERVPVASPSIAQVHLATLKDGREVAAKAGSAPRGRRAPPRPSAALDRRLPRRPSACRPRSRPPQRRG